MAERTLPDWASLDAEGKAKEEEVTWLDDDHAVTWTQWPEETEPHGGVLWHRKQNDTWCCGAWYVRPPMYEGKPFRENVPIWTLESKEPLTLLPSFLCHCGHHGWISNGTWVSA